VKILGSELGEEQRLTAAVRITIDTKNLRNGGERLMLIQIQDAQGRMYQGCGTLSLPQPSEDARRAEIAYGHRALLSPRDYRVTLAMFDPS
jgi:hypothetical protein